MYKVLDAFGETLGEFPTFEEAHKFRLTATRSDWTIKKV